MCPRCGGPVHVRTRHLQIEGSAVRVFCSQRCATEPTVVAEPPPAPRPSPWRHVLRLAAGADEQTVRVAVEYLETRLLEPADLFVLGVAS